MKNISAEFSIIFQQNIKVMTFQMRPRSSAVGGEENIMTNCLCCSLDVIISGTSILSSGSTFSQSSTTMAFTSLSWSSVCIRIFLIIPGVPTTIGQVPLFSFGITLNSGFAWKVIYSSPSNEKHGRNYSKHTDDKTRVEFYCETPVWRAPLFISTHNFWTLWLLDITKSGTWNEWFLLLFKLQISHTITWVVGLEYFRDAATNNAVIQKFPSPSKMIFFPDEASKY